MPAENTRGSSDNGSRDAITIPGGNPSMQAASHNNGVDEEGLQAAEEGYGNIQETEAFSLTEDEALAREASAYQEQDRYGGRLQRNEGGGIGPNPDIAARKEELKRTWQEEGFASLDQALLIASIYDPSTPAVLRKIYLEELDSVAPKRRKTGESEGGRTEGGRVTVNQGHLIL